MPDRRTIVLLLLAWLAVLGRGAAADDGGGPPDKASPFGAVRWNGDEPEVRFVGVWYLCHAIDGVPAADVLAFCEATWPGRARKRFSEDLVEAMQRMGQPVRATVSLDLVSLEGGESIHVDVAPMTFENRQSVLQFNRRAERLEPPAPKPPAPPPAQRVKRKHAGVVDPADVGLVARPCEPLRRPVVRISRAAVAEDLDEFEHFLEHRHSYLTLRDVDHRRMLDSIRAACPDELGVDDFAIQLQRVMTRFGDGHAGVMAIDRLGRSDQHLFTDHGPETPPRRTLLPGRFAPFLLARTAGGIVAYMPDRSGCLDETYPFVRAIDGRPIEAWIKAARPTVVDGSPSLRRDRGFRRLRHLAYVALEMTGELPNQVTVEVHDDAGDAIEVGVVLVDRKPIFGAWPRGASATLVPDGENGPRIGYLRLRDMQKNAAPLVRAHMPDFVDTDGLIVDVRGNTGGRREAMREFLPWLMPPGAAPRVVNVAAYRVNPAFSPEAFRARGLHRPDEPDLPAASSAAIHAALGDFAPVWPPPADAFSDWYGCAISRDAAAAHFDGPVVVLQDEACFSATDIFLGAMAEMPGVTLMGVASGGGSGCATVVELRNSRLKIRFSTMASFRPNGRPYDTYGVEPDATIERQPMDLIHGGGDTQLDAAIAWIVDRAR